MPKPRILIVDDEMGLTRLLRMSLEMTGAYEVREEHTGAHALAAAQDFRPDLILLDVILPDRSGREVAADIRADAQLRRTPIVFMTATVSKDATVPRGDLVGGYPVLAKPVSVERLMACVAQHLGTHRVEEA